MFYTFKARKMKIFFFAATMVVFFVGVALMLVNMRYPVRYIESIYKYAGEAGLEPALICAIIHAESKFDSSAYSYKGASGLMQITEPTADWLAEEMKLDGYSYDRIFEPEINIRIGSYYINRLINRYEALDVALAAYNAGSGNVNKWLSDDRYSGDGYSLSYIPFKETRDYIGRVRRNKVIYGIILRIKQQM